MVPVDVRRPHPSSQKAGARRRQRGESCTLAAACHQPSDRRPPACHVGEKECKTVQNSAVADRPALKTVQRNQPMHWIQGRLYCLQGRLHQIQGSLLPVHLRLAEGLWFPSELGITPVVHRLGNPQRRRARFENTSCPHGRALSQVVLVRPVLNHEWVASAE